MHDTSALETLEGFSNVLARVQYTKSELEQSSTLWLTLVNLGIPHGGQQCALLTLSQLLSMPYRWNTRVL